MQAILIFLAALFIQSCLSGSDEPKELDVSMKISQSEKEENARLKERQEKINARKAIPWQKFFKPSPSESEKKLIQTMLDSEKQSEDYAGLMKRGYNQLTLGLVKDAEISFRQANRIDESKLEPVLEIARIHLRRNEISECLEYLAYIKNTLDAQEEQDSDFVFKYRYLLALTKIKAGDTEYARTILRDLISVQPDFAPGYVTLAMTYIHESNERAAEFIIRRGMDRSPENANFYVALGAIAKKKERNSLAARYFNKALELDANNVPALVNRSTIAIENYEYERAELDLKTALSIEPDSEDALISLAVVQKRTGRVAAARGTLERAIETNPTSALARFHLAELFLQDLDDAEYALQLYYEVLQTQTSQESLRMQATSQIEKIKQSRL